MDKTSSKYWFVCICLAMTLVTLAVYWQMCQYDFVNFDDYKYVGENPHVRYGFTREGIKWAFTNFGYAGNWHPLTWLSHILDCQLYGVDPGRQHLTNLFLHIANTLLLFAVFSAMTGTLWQSAFVAALFVLHPMHVESVAWISERKDLLSTLFWLLTMWAYVRYCHCVAIPATAKQTPTTGVGAKHYYLLTIVFFIFGLLSKPMLVTLPFVLLLLDYWPLERFGKRSVYNLILEKIPLFVLSAVSSVITVFVQKIITVDRLPFNLRIANAFISYVRYIGKMIWPCGLTFFYPYPGLKISFFYVATSAVLLLAVTVLIIRFAGKHRYIVTGWLWYLGTLFPVIGLVQVGGQAMADRYSYIPLTGLFIIIAFGLPELLGKLPHRKIVLWISSLIILSVLAVCAYFQQQYWKNTAVLCQHAIKVTKNNYLAHSCMAEYFLNQKMFDDAIMESRKSLEIKPEGPEALNVIGVILSQQGKSEEAIEYFAKALQIKPDFAATHDNMGHALLLQGNLDEAAVHFAESLRLDPDAALPHYHLGQVLSQRGKITDAVIHFEKAIRLKPYWFEPMNDLAWILSVNKDAAIRNPVRAVGLARRACELTNYENPGILDTLAAAYASAGNFSMAIETSMNALKLCKSPRQDIFKKEIESRLVLYRAGESFIETNAE
ncbi:MAG: tetratricopeptide repeat protein [Phycisphaerae bacterium]|jgi:tetratricopeptide (TPR) repeat protein